MTLIEWRRVACSVSEDTQHATRNTQHATMPKSAAVRPKHVPQRTCIACRQVGGKRGLVRLVRTEQGVAVDPSGKQAGRGAYLHRERRCWEVALKGYRIEQALRTKLSPESRRALVEFMETLPAVTVESVGDSDEAVGVQTEGQTAQADGKE